MPRATKLNLDNVIQKLIQDCSDVRIEKYNKKFDKRLVITKFYDEDLDNYYVELSYIYSNDAIIGNIVLNEYYDESEIVYVFNDYNNSENKAIVIFSNENEIITGLAKEYYLIIHAYQLDITQYKIEFVDR